MFLLEFFTLVAVFVFAISASLSAIKKKFDLFGISFIAFITSLGGGTVRDMMLGNYPISWLRDSSLAISVLLGIAATMIFTKRLRKIRKTFFWFDTIGIGVSTVVGVEKGMAAGLDGFISIFFGVIGAIFGGIIRDTLCNDVPLIFRKEVYAITCIIGGGIYVITKKLNCDIITIYGQNIPIGIIATMLLIIFMRYYSIKHKIQVKDFNYKLTGKKYV
jgi:uncharacterized membrane protein YeiH